MYLFIAYGVLAVLALVGFAWLTVAITRGKTLYHVGLPSRIRWCACWLLR